MKILCLIALLMFAPAAMALTPDLNLYLRAGENNNLKGGGQDCIGNNGAWGNEFRLGNECNIYGEFGFGAYILKDDNGKGPMWRFFSDFAVYYDNKTDWENVGLKVQNTNTTPQYVSSASLTNNNNWILREVYTEGGGFDGMDFHVWVGKRYYRWGDIHMDDFFPVLFSGPGGGISDLHSGIGTWSVAVIQDANSNEINGNGGVTTNSGQAAKTSLHIRLDDSETSFGKFSYWLAGASTPQTEAKDGSQDYKQGTGLFFAVKDDADLANGVGNELGVAYGNGVMTNMGPDGELVKNCADDTSAACTVMSSDRTRVWDALTVDSGKWSGQAAFVYDSYNKGTADNAHVRWTSFGVRPEYWFTDHYSLVFQAGVSEVLDESDGHGSRDLARFTIAPQLSLGKGYWSRPVIRVFYSHTQWNANNMVSAANTSAYNDTYLDSVGMQTEVWF